MSPPAAANSLSPVKSPILILSGLAGIEDKIKGLGFGADDYMTKPFHKDELVARIHAIVRRSKGHAQSVISRSGGRASSRLVEIRKTFHELRIMSFNALNWIYDRGISDFLQRTQDERRSANRN
jgi:DNA-binding response OmpR family regulator